jgi:hypothetical protein
MFKAGSGKESNACVDITHIILFLQEEQTRLMIFQRQQWSPLCSSYYVLVPLIRCPPYLFQND